MKLNTLLNNYDKVIYCHTTINLDTTIKDLKHHSQHIKQDDIFLATNGINHQGDEFLEQVFQQGAKFAILDLNKQTKYQEVAQYKDKLIFVEDINAFTAFAIYQFYHHYLPNTIFAVTGTNGKTSVTNFISQYLANLNIANILIGTNGVYLNQQHIDDCLTTPFPNDVVNYLQIAKQQHIDVATLEASSHALEQKRIDYLPITVAGFTNLTHDHLDYHQTFDNYFQAKQRLFTTIAHKLVINVDDKYGAQIYQACKALNKPIIDYGKTAHTLKIDYIINHQDSQIIALTYQQQHYLLTTPLIGEFQAYNIVCAIGMLLIHNYPIDTLINISNQLTPINGRLELIAHYNKNKIFVDFAHTPDSLYNILTTLKKLPHRKLKLVFGCGGNRDQAKRSIMGEIAAKYSDEVFITNDNPRYENPDNIRQQIIQGIINTRLTTLYHNVADRKQAIQQAIQSLHTNDILLIAGKGHEMYQIIQDDKRYFSDKQTTLNIINHLDSRSCN